MRTRRRDFIEKTLRRLAESLEQSDRADHCGAATGFLQRSDPRVKLVGFLSLIFAAAASQRLIVTGALFATGLLLASVSRVLGSIARLWVGVLFFTGTIVLPALFLIPGRALFHIPGAGWAVTDHGLHSALGLIARALTSATLAALLVLTTRWGHLLKALRVLRVPALLVAILGMTYRSLFVLLGIARDFFEARRVRTVGRLENSQRRQMAASSAAMLLSKSVQLSGEVYEAMQARGFRGEIRTLDAFRMERRDWCMLVAFGIAALAAFILGVVR